MRTRFFLLGICILTAISTPAPAQAPVNALPWRIGADQEGGNSFRGTMAGLRLFTRALTAEEIGKLREAGPEGKALPPGLAAQWIAGGTKDKLSLDDKVHPAKLVGAVAASSEAGAPCARFEGGYLEAASDPAIDSTKGLTIEAWVRPVEGSVGRILDKISPGGTNGVLLDTYPGNGFRLIVGTQTLTTKAAPGEKWAHVVGTVDAYGLAALFLDGRRVSGEGTGLAEGVTPAPDGPGDPLTLWYRQPARRWTEASVIGNGRLGGMVWGGVKQERIDLNEDTLWSGEPYDNINPKGKQAFPGIQALLLAGQNNEAQQLVERDMNGKYNECYMPMGALLIENTAEGEVTGYRRELDLGRAVARTTYDQGGLHVTRESFASHPGQAILVHFGADKPGRLGFKVRLESQMHNQVEAKGNALRLRGRCPVHADPHYVGRKVEFDDAPDGKGMRFEVRVLAANQGGRVRTEGESLVVEGCDEVTLMLVAATSYNGPHKSPSREGLDPAKRCEADMAAVRGKSYPDLRAAHVSDHRRLFDRVRLSLGESEAARWPTDLRVQRYQSGTDPSLAALYFQFGRYLLIAGSRPGTQPLNLQGIWNNQINPAWSANWTLNCNAQINYWGVEPANLAECHEPLLDLTRELSVDGAHIAKDLYGAGGWVAHHNTDIWRQAGPVSGSACWSMFPVGGTWLCQHLWEHYAFSGDADTLREIWPVLAGAARFHLDTLIEEPKHHWLVTAPDTNFENAWKRPDGGSGCTCMGATASLQMVRQLLRNCLEGANKVIATNSVSASEIEKALPRLAPMQVSPTTGELQEWIDDWQRTAACQVLSSWGAVCSDQITPRRTPELAAGLKKIYDQGAWWKSGAVCSWQGAFQSNTYARLHDGDTALAVLDTHLRVAPNPNLTAKFAGMAEFQIDGNLGQMAAICEMLVQSQAGEIEFLPALPKAWPDGAVSGLRARGGFTVDLAWKEGRLGKCLLRSDRGGEPVLRYGEATKKVSVPAHGEVAVDW